MIEHRHQRIAAIARELSHRLNGAEIVAEPYPVASPSSGWTFRLASERRGVMVGLRTLDSEMEINALVDEILARLPTEK